MAHTARSGRVVIVASAEALTGLEGRLRRQGVRADRLTGLDRRAEPPSRWLTDALRRGGFDTVLATSPAAVEFGVVPWHRARSVRSSVEYWTVGPATARRLRRLDLGPVRVGRGLGSSVLLRALGVGRRRRILYLRSDRAGRRLGRALRSQGHSVAEAVVYRLAPPRPLSRTARAALRGADVLVVSSPSALCSLRDRLTTAEFGWLRRRCRVVVLGTRSLHGARGHGFRGTSIAPSSDAQRLTQEVLRRLRDGTPSR